MPELRFLNELGEQTVIGMEYAVEKSRLREWPEGLGRTALRVLEMDQHRIGALHPGKPSRSRAPLVIAKFGKNLSIQALANVIPGDAKPRRGTERKRFVGREAAKPKR